MSAKKHLEALMRFHEEKEIKEKQKAESANTKAALGKFIKEKNKNTLGEENKIEFLM